jgi:hypothetical protein
MEEIEIWKDIPGYEGIYQASTYGRIKRMARILSDSYGRSVSLKERILNPYLSSNKYVIIELSKYNASKTLMLHQLIAITFLGHVINSHVLVVDHIDGDRRNNKASNLQVVTHRENTSTCFRKDRSTFSSRYTGVGWLKRNKKWRAQIQINGKQTYLGLFDTEVEASNAYQNTLKTIL